MSLKNILFVFLGFIVFNAVFNTQTQMSQEIPYSQLDNMISNRDLSDVTVNNNQIDFNTNNESYFVKLPNNSDAFKDVLDKLDSNNVEYQIIEDNSGPSFIQELFFSMLPLLLLFAFIWYMMNKTSGSMSKIMPNKKRFEVVNPDDLTTTFNDIAGIDSMKNEVVEVVDFLRNPEKYQNMGSELPKGVLLIGSPGTGKTLLAKAMAKEAECNFLSISGSDFVEMFVGLGASRVREMFTEAKKNKPCIIFIDEIDAVGKKRGAVGGGANDEREQTLNQLLVEMNGFKDEKGIVVIAATNKPETLDSALVRPGRFDRTINVPLPTIDGREEILKVHASKKKMASNINYRDVAKGTVGFSGADLANLINEASILATRKNKENIDEECIEEAKDKIIMGEEVSGTILSDKEKELTAYHESGHAIIGYLAKDHDKIHKVTIVPRGKALGVTVFLPEKDRVSMSKADLLDQIRTLYGGRIAEEKIYGPDRITTGASNDIERATMIAHKMVTEWGLSSLGPIHIDEKINNYGEKVTYSDKKLDEIDNEVKKIINECYDEASKIIEENLDKLEKMAKILLEEETINKDKVIQIMNNEV